MFYHIYVFCKHFFIKSYFRYQLPFLLFLHRGPPKTTLVELDLPVIAHMYKKFDMRYIINNFK